MVNDCRIGVNVATTINGKRTVYPIHSTKNDSMRSFDDFMTHFSNIFNKKISRPESFIVLNNKKSVLYEAFKQCWHSDEDIMFDVALRAVFIYHMLTPIGFGAITSHDLRKYIERNIDARALFDIGDDLEMSIKDGIIEMRSKDVESDGESDESALWDDESDTDDDDEISDEELEKYFKEVDDNKIEVIINGTNFSHSVLLMSSADDELIKMLTLCVIDGFTSNFRNPAVSLSCQAKAGKYNDLSDEDYAYLFSFIKRISYVWYNKKYASVFDLIVDVSELIVLFGATGLDCDTFVCKFFTDFEKINHFWRKRTSDESDKTANKRSVFDDIDE